MKKAEAGAGIMKEEVKRGCTGRDLKLWMKRAEAGAGTMKEKAKRGHIGRDLKLRMKRAEVGAGQMSELGMMEIENLTQKAPEVEMKLGENKSDIRMHSLFSIVCTLYIFRERKNFNLIHYILDNFNV